MTVTAIPIVQRRTLSQNEVTILSGVTRSGRTELSWGPNPCTFPLDYIIEREEYQSGLPSLGSGPACWAELAPTEMSKGSESHDFTVSIQNLLFGNWHNHIPPQLQQLLLDHPSFDFSLSQFRKALALSSVDSDYQQGGRITLLSLLTSESLLLTQQADACRDLPTDDDL